MDFYCQCKKSKQKYEHLNEEIERLPLLLNIKIENGKCTLYGTLITSDYKYLVQYYHYTPIFFRIINYSKVPFKYKKLTAKEKRIQQLRKRIEQLENSFKVGKGGLNNESILLDRNCGT